MVPVPEQRPGTNGHCENNFTENVFPQLALCKCLFKLFGYIQIFYHFAKHFCLNSKVEENSSMKWTRLVTCNLTESFQQAKVPLKSIEQEKTLRIELLLSLHLKSFQSPQK